MALSNQAPATRASLLYITGGSVLFVWTIVWTVYLLFNPPASGKIWYIVFGLLATSLVLVSIGMRLGSIGRSAKQAETPPVAGPPATATPVVPIPSQQQPVVVQAPPQAAQTTPAPVVTVVREPAAPVNPTVPPPVSAPPH